MLAVALVIDIIVMAAVPTIHPTSAPSLFSLPSEVEQGEDSGSTTLLVGAGLADNVSGKVWVALDSGKQNPLPARKMEQNGWHPTDIPMHTQFA